MMPSLSVVHTDPSRCRNDAPADSSPPNATDPSSSPGTNHLNPTGTSSSVRPSESRDPVDHRRADERLADRGVGGPLGAVRVQVVDRDGQVVVRVHQPGVGRDDAVPVGVGVVAGRDVEVVLACRSSEAIADGDEQSIRILPSQSSVMKPNVLSTSGFTTVRSSPYRAPISPQ